MTSLIKFADVVFLSTTRTADMRQKLVDADLVDCVLGLGSNLFYNSPMEACVVICSNNKPAERRGQVIFIDAVNEVTRERSMSYLKPEHQGRVADAYHAFKDVEGFAKVASLADIRANDGNLSIPLYVRGKLVEYSLLTENYHAARIWFDAWSGPDPKHPGLDVYRELLKKINA
jgi:type I restriction enzyme M protein